MGHCYYNGYGVPLNYREAIRLFRESHKFDLFSLYSLGICYLNGQGTQKNVRTAYLYLKSAADQGYSHASFKLANCYELGVDFDRNDVEALHWYRLAAQQGFTGAQEKVIQFGDRARNNQNIQQPILYQQQIVQHQHLRATVNSPANNRDAASRSKCVIL